MLKRITVLSIMAAIAMLVGCSGRRTSPAGETTRVVTDGLGRSVTIPIKITRVVSLAPSATENIFAAGGGSRIVGDTTFCNYPDAALSIQKVGDTLSPNMETIVALKPEIVFVSSASQIQAFEKTLEQNGIAVYVMAPTTLDGVLSDIDKLGDIFGTEDTAGRLVLDLKKRVNDIQFRVNGESRPRVFVQISREPLFTIGADAFLTDVITEAGGTSVTSTVQGAFPKLSKETASALDPEVIILSDSEDNRAPNDVLASSPAVRDGKVYKMNADTISRPGPRLVDVLEKIARYLHPDKFDTPQTGSQTLN